ncbi:hypothetical protein [Rhodococcus sp. NPDC049939]|uniref:hypothetical protein n=1 Tax=Rhodococcus sp. NPDC049939 TaxID=3155511 RepID=UPI0033DB58AE
MKFRLEVDLTKLDGNETEELSRVLRYWAGNLSHYDLKEKPSEAIYDSAYNPVGTWVVS